jgi:hypothetical protein
VGATGRRLGGAGQLAVLVLLVFLGARRSWRTCSSGLSVLASSMSNTTSEKGPSSSRCSAISSGSSMRYRHHQLLAGGEGEVVEGVGVAGQVDLGGQVLVSPARR